jgi:uncharacterized protein YicC (UPF0701 family)
MLHKDIRDIQTCMQQFDASIDSALESMRSSKNKNGAAVNEDIKNAFLIIESAMQKVLWKKEEIEKAKKELRV